MGFWSWFSVFAAITVLSLASYAAIGIWLARKAKGLQAPAERLQALSEKLEATRAAHVEVAQLVSAIDQDAGAALKRRKGVLKANKLRKEQRQRRLIERLRTMKIDGSRFR
jgi:hypothetical protein